MAGFADILGSLVQSGMAGSGNNRLTSVLGSLLGGTGGKEGEGDLMSSLGGMFNQGGGLQGGGLGDMLGSLLSGLSGSQSSQGGLGGVIGDVLGNLGNNKSAISGLGALGGALIGGGRGAAKGAVGGGALALLASLAVSALKRGGQTPVQTPAALYEEPQQADLDNEAEILVQAMINAAKADGKLDKTEMQRILGKLDDDGLTDEEKQFFTSEAQAPLNLDAVIASAGGRPELAAQIYAASLLTIEVDTAAEQQYMQQLARGLALAPETVAYIEQSLVK
ncbi:tellurite resistance TerB family protein [Desulforhopalus vacuolatus]|uniref:tellurite resistance TerB family protein n=1 Tax=Desulforhopalus vacuolatus TaxID=40414 RepID=UPI001962B673|nr:tellurite resistance TerB family protein [Desulforhopalus vacuolatus]MBM9519114.1 tellurite resistance TerB family protein [Desulforhopalus vacuolatus]